MGMYDYINGEQVKCFYYPIYCKDGMGQSKSTWHSGGMLRSFSTGDEVPTETLYYKYPKNFAIIDCDCHFDESNSFIHIIINSKVFKTMTLSDLEKRDLVNIETFITYSSSELLINNYEDLHKYLHDSKMYKEKIDNVSLLDYIAPRIYKALISQ